MRWYWCLEHNRPEPEDGKCRADNRLGPYETQEDAIAWRERVESRNESWAEQDEAWHGDESD